MNCMLRDILSYGWSGCRKSDNVAPASGVVFSVFNRWGDRGDIRTLRQFVPTSNSEDLLQVLHIRWVGRTFLLIARHGRSGRIGASPRGPQGEARY